MQEFNTHQRPRRFAHHRAMLVALAVLAVGGVTLAATDGVAKLKQWLVTLEINGETMEVALDDNGEATFDYEMADGGTATVNIQKTDTPDDGAMTQIRVVQQGDQTEDVEVAKIIQKCSPGQAARKYTLDDLGDAELVKNWSDANGISHDLYTVVQKNGDWIFFIASQTVEGEEPVVRQVARIPTTVLPADAKPTVNVGDDGMLTLKFNNGEGEERVMKVLIRRGNGDDVNLDRRQIKVRTRTGDEIKINVDQIDKNEEK